MYLWPAIWQLAFRTALAGTDVRRMQRESPDGSIGKGKGKRPATFNTASRPSIFLSFIHCGSKIRLKL
jgi:hypothetical protein